MNTKEYVQNLMNEGITDLKEMLEVAEAEHPNMNPAQVKRFRTIIINSQEIIPKKMEVIPKKMEEEIPEEEEMEVMKEAILKMEEKMEALHRMREDTMGILARNLNTVLQSLTEAIANLGVPAGSTSNPAAALSEDQLNFINECIEFNKRVDQERLQIPDINAQIAAIEKECPFDLEDNYDHSNLTKDLNRLYELKKIGE